MQEGYEDIEDIRKDFFKVKQLLDQNELLKNIFIKQKAQMRQLQARINELELYVHSSKEL